ncbi:solute carrier family 41 member 1 [Ixodes scapularis]|uniref:solute carrier family 41 member 1 n=1 Tax=Ixodes scapularis TaxID=6945 RepID=UPI001A9CEEFA|nr:solute carrier family 41 member 1 [Ixodes scapularis]
MPPQNESLEPAKTGSSIVDSVESSDDLVQTAAAAMLDLSAAEPGLATIHGVRRGLPKDPEDLRSSRAAISEKLVLLEKAPEALDEFSCLLGTPHQESCYVFLAQVFPSFMLAGAGMVVAGLLLDIVQSWQVFIKVPQLFVLVPALLGLKGNLEMTLASRLSTQANLGKTESMVDVFRLACGNMALLQCQSVVVGTLASLYAIATSLVASEDVSMRCGILVVSSSIITASSASLLLGGIMISVVVSSKCCRLNPDNVSIPIAAALGDVITLGLLAFVSAAIFQFLDALPWISLLVSGPLVLLLPVWTYVAYKNQDTRDVLSSGWLPIISAMLISSLSGNILDVAIKKFPNMAAFQPLMNGLGGNLAAVHASRMSTLLHRQRTYRDKSVQGAALNGGASISLSDSTILGASSRRGFILAALVVPGHLVFMNLVSLAKSGTPTTNVGFIVLFCTAGLVQVIALLFAARAIVGALWRRNLDPDSTAIPYVTALGDLLGTALLALVCWVLLGTVG